MHKAVDSTEVKYHSSLILYNSLLVKGHYHGNLLF